MGIFMEASLCKCNKLLTAFPAPSPLSGEVGIGGDWTFQASSNDLIFLVINPHPGANQEYAQSPH